MRFMIVLASIACIVVSLGCRARRPASVPEGAVPVSFSSSGGWAYCWLDTTIHLNRCRTYNSEGKRLYRFRKEDDDDDVFLRYEGSGPVPPNQLRIDVVHTNVDFVWLENGIVLLPRNDFEHQKKFVGEIMRAGNEPQH